MFLGLVRLRTFRLAHGLLRCKLERGCWRARGEDVSFTDVKIKIPDRRYDQGMWMTSCTGSVCGEFWEIWEKSVSWVLSRKNKVDFRLLAMALRRVRTWFGADGKVSIERWYLSPYVEKPLNSKVIKSFVPELRSRKCFLCSRISMLSVYMDIMNILCTFHTSISWSYIWLWYTINPRSTQIRRGSTYYSPIYGSNRCV